MSAPALRVLVVDDEPAFRLFVSTVLRDAGYEVTTAQAGTEALARVMIEAESAGLMHKHADAIAGAIQKALGA